MNRIGAAFFIAASMGFFGVSEAIAGGFDGVWSGELISKSGGCGFSKRDIRVKINNNNIYAESYDNINKKVPFEGTIDSNGEFLIYGKREWEIHCTRWDCYNGGYARLAGRVSKQKIVGRLKAGINYSDACRAEFELVNVSAAAQARKRDEARLKAEEVVRRKADEEARQLAEEERIRKLVAREKKRTLEEERQRMAAEMKKLDEEKRRLAQQADKPIDAVERNRVVQEALQALDFYHGKIDGSLGLKSRAAVRQWQSKKGFKRTGVLTEEQFASLEQDALKALSEPRVAKTEKKTEEEPRKRPEAVAYRDVPLSIEML